MPNPLKNWKTTSLGILTVSGAVVNLVFAVKHGVDDQGTWIFAITQILSGIGLVFAPDASAGAQDHLQSQQQIAELQLRSNIIPNAIESGDTSTLRKVPITPASVPPPVVLPDSVLSPQPIIPPKNTVN